MMPELPRTGFPQLDAASRPRAPRSGLGTPQIGDPTRGQAPSRSPYSFPSPQWGQKGRLPYNFEEINDAYDTDSIVRQGVRKQIELQTKLGWGLDCETEEPLEYLRYRFEVMGHLIEGQKCWDSQIDDVVSDFSKYSNAFLVKARRAIPELPGMPVRGAHGLPQPVACYFRADPSRIEPYFNKPGTKQTGWRYTKKSGQVVVWGVADVLHFPFDVRVGEQVFGTPLLTPVLDDVRAYRQAEEMVLRLLHKHLHPLLHHEVPDLAGTGAGRQEDVDAAAARHRTIAPDGFIVTPPNHKISIIGAESKALRGEGFMKLIRERVYTGLGVNDAVMGGGQVGGEGTADMMTASMHNAAKAYQRSLGFMLQQGVLNELLLEGGFDPLRPQDKVRWFWEDIERETLLKEQNHLAQLYANGGIEVDEFRRGLKRKPFTDEQLQRTHVHMVRIPEIEAEAEARARSTPRDGGDNDSKSKNRPSNQHGVRPGPKIRPK